MNRLFFQLDDMFYNISTVVFKFVLLSHVTENQSRAQENPYAPTDSA
jgi:hypothetical protein